MSVSQSPEKHVHIELRGKTKDSEVRAKQAVRYSTTKTKTRSTDVDDDYESILREEARNGRRGISHLQHAAKATIIRRMYADVCRATAALVYLGLTLCLAPNPFTYLHSICIIGVR